MGYNFVIMAKDRKIPNDAIVHSNRKLVKLAGLKRENHPTPGSRLNSFPTKKKPARAVLMQTNMLTNKIDKKGGSYFLI